MNNKIFKSAISHDKESNRVYLMNLDPEDFPEIISYVEELANINQYSKLFAKVPAKYGPTFLAAGYVNEASIPDFYNHQEDALFLVKYKFEERSFPETGALISLQQMLLQPANHEIHELDECYTMRLLTEKDPSMMIPIFKEVFETYPFPIYDPSFLLKSMLEYGTRYFGAFYDKKLVAISSAECNDYNKNAEMTDFAVLQAHRGKRLSTHLLSFMEKALDKDGFKTLYTIARLRSLPMNKTFYNNGYKYAGTLTRNTQISGKIESMNVWYKKI
ncbi:MAG: putative beta-lysine N-acetyltransferase [Paludibacter sp.]|nr:putative beta-lysine N-acetyltransferase [Paludibacter sp.]